jgi:hypothetical protein
MSMDKIYTGSDGDATNQENWTLVPAERRVPSIRSISVKRAEGQLVVNCPIEVAIEAIGFKVILNYGESLIICCQQPDEPIIR